PSQSEAHHGGRTALKVWPRSQRQERKLAFDAEQAFHPATGLTATKAFDLAKVGVVLDPPDRAFSLQGLRGGIDQLAGPFVSGAARTQYPQAQMPIRVCIAEEEP